MTIGMVPERWVSVNTWLVSGSVVSNAALVAYARFGEPASYLALVLAVSQRIEVVRQISQLLAQFVGEPIIRAGEIDYATACEADRILRAERDQRVVSFPRC